MIRKTILKNRAKSCCFYNLVNIYIFIQHCQRCFYSTLLQNLKRALPTSTCAVIDWIVKCINRRAFLLIAACSSRLTLISRKMSFSLVRGTTWICTWGRNNVVRLKFYHQVEDSVPYLWSVLPEERREQHREAAAYRQTWNHWPL